MANSSPFLDFDERPDLYVIADLAAVQIRKRENLDPLAKFHVRCDSLEKLIAVVHAGIRLRSGSGEVPLPRPLPLPEWPLLAWPFELPLALVWPFPPLFPLPF